MQIVKDYRDNKVLRDSFNGLAKKAPMDTADDWEKMVKVMKSKAQCGNRGRYAYDPCEFFEEASVDEVIASFGSAIRRAALIFYADRPDGLRGNGCR